VTKTGVSIAAYLKEDDLFERLLKSVVEEDMTEKQNQEVTD
jgi:hypothetical protein